MTQPRGGSSKQDRKRELDAKAWKVLCPKCAAQPGEPCRTEAGDAAGVHRDRRRQASYLPIDGPAPA